MTQQQEQEPEQQHQYQDVDAAPPPLIAATADEDVLAHVCLSCHRQFNNETFCPFDESALLAVSANPFAGTDLGLQYEVEGLVGMGGWSLVYRVRQKSLGRLVAFKIMHSHLMFDPEKKARFQREAEAASTINHPSIPAVYDYGVLPTGQPYMAMAYVEGMSLEQVISSAGILQPMEAIRIFTEAASALGVAHQHGVIHRDIKPSNILLTEGKREVKILDFGIAKVLSGGPGEVMATLTQAGHTIGTPAYMSPEQCLGQPVDGRSDIYSLGCVMYEALTAIRLFEGKDAFEAMSLHMREDIRFEDTPENKRIPFALQQCILRALAKKPSDRYQNAAELVSDLQKIAKQTRHHDTALRALNTMKMLARGNKVSALVAAGVSCAVILCLVLTVYDFSEKANKAASRASRNIADSYKESMAKGERQFFAGQYDKAATSFQQAVDLAENFGASDERLGNSLRRLETSLKKAGKDHDAQKVAEHIDALKNSTYGLMYGTPEQNANTIMLLTAKREQNPKDVTVARDLCAVLNNQAALMFTQSNVTGAKEFLERALEIEEKSLGKEDPEYATTLSNLAYYQAQTGHVQEAEALYKQALELRQKILGSSDPKVGRSLRNLSDFYWQQGDGGRALTLMQQSMEVYKRQLPKTAADYAWTVNNLGLLHASQKKYPEARKYFDEALDIRKELYGDSGLDVGRTLHNLAQLDTVEKNYPQAEQKYLAALKIYDTKLGTDHDDTLKCVNALAMLYYAQHDFSDTEPLLKRLYATLRDKRPGDPMVARTHDILAKIYTEQGRKDALKALDTQ